MVIKKLILLTIISILIVGCTVKNSVKEVNLIESELIYSDSINLFRVSDFNIYENSLIFMNINNDKIFSYLDLDTKELVKFGAKGRAENEFIQASGKFLMYDSSLVVNDFGRRILYSIPIEKILLKQSEWTEVLKYPYSRDFRPRDFIITDYHNIGIGSFANGMLGIIDKQDNITDITIPYPLEDNKIDGIFKGAIYQTLIRKQPSGNKFILSILSSDIFEIFDSSESGITSIFKSADGNVPVLKERPGNVVNYAIDYKNSIAGYTDIFATDDYIYMGYSNLSYEEYASNGTIREIHCYDWQGKKICIYHLPKEINGFCVDQDIIYALKENINCTEIYKIRLSEN